jgi:hypothetical protein
MTHEEMAFKTQYERLVDAFRNMVIDHNEHEVRLLYQMRDQMQTIAKLQRELEASNEVVENLLAYHRWETVDNRFPRPEK